MSLQPHEHEVYSKIGCIFSLCDEAHNNICVEPRFDANNAVMCPAHRGLFERSYLIYIHA